MVNFLKKNIYNTYIMKKKKTIFKGEIYLWDLQNEEEALIAKS
jgi:hypothetical protein